ncbi:MAG: glycosyltransferase family 9 protein [Chlorobi bacterium]|nr:glycosyltransferase family 9 protein [Chlorobiota bacterium]
MKILVIRLSAMGDVALSVPVIKAALDRYKEAEIYLMTNKLYNSFFPENPKLHFINPDLKGKHKGITGLFALYRQTKKEISPDIVIDIHDVLRTKILRLFFALTGIKTYKTDKGRKEKRKLTRKKNKILKPLKHTSRRYAGTFAKAGLPLILEYKNKIKPGTASNKIKELIAGKEKKIGIAPFAKHRQKQYPLEKTEKLIKLLTDNGFSIFLFGGGEKEQKIAENIASKYDNTTSVIGKLSIKEEIELIDNLDIMISPDSGNMHIAALTSVKIISIWGATHPYAGFTPFVPENRHFIIQNNNLECRPCSVFGNKSCYKNSLECLNTIKPEGIAAICNKITKNI